MISIGLATFLLGQVPQIKVKPDVIRGLSPVSKSQKAALLSKLGLKADLSRTTRFVLSGDQPLSKSPIASLRFQGKLKTDSTDPTQITMDESTHFFRIHINNPKTGSTAPLPRYTYLVHVFVKAEGRELLDWKIAEAPRIDRMITNIGLYAENTCTIPLAHASTASEVSFQVEGRYGVPLVIYKVEVDIIPEVKR